MGQYENRGDSEEFFHNLGEEFGCDGEPVPLPIEKSIQETKTRLQSLLEEKTIWYVAGLVDAILILMAVRYLVG